MKVWLEYIIYLIFSFCVQIVLLNYIVLNMPPKPKPAAPSKKTEQKKKEKIIEVLLINFCIFWEIISIFSG